MAEIDTSKISAAIDTKYTVENNTFLTTAKDVAVDKIEVEIGDSKQTDFLPQVKIQRWDNEVNFSARLIHEETAPVVSTLVDKIVWEGDKVSANFYDITEDEGGYEFEVILKEKPKSNVVQFTLNTKGLDFFYQPELTEDEIKEGAERPENVVGSYAVYASENKTNYVGGKEYKCGKVGHIYRPRIEDAKGNKVWGELNVDTENGILSVTIPQDFLDKAVYPVRHAAGLTFGYTTYGTGGAGYTCRGRYDTPYYYSYRKGSVFTLSENATLSKITAGVKPVTYAQNIDITVFINLKDGGGAGKHTEVAKIERTNVNLPKANTVTWLDFTTTESLSAGDYILSMVSSKYGLVSGTTLYNVESGSDNGGSELRIYKSNSATDGTGYPTLRDESPLVYTCDGDQRYSIYATYTASGGTATVKTINGFVPGSVKSINGTAIASHKTLQGFSLV